MENNKKITEYDDVTAEEVALADRLEPVDTDSLVPDPDTVVLHDDAEEPSTDDARTRVARHESLYPRLVWADGDGLHLLSVTGSSLLVGRAAAAAIHDRRFRGVQDARLRASLGRLLVRQGRGERQWYVRGWEQGLRGVAFLGYVFLGWGSGHLVPGSR